MDLFLRGVAIGFVIAAGLGPIGLLTVRRTLEGGFALGLATGLGAATADASYAAVAAIGGAALGALVVAIRQPLGVVGGIVLIALGIHAVRHGGNAVTAASQRPTRALGMAWLSTFGLTLSNPMTVLSFAAAFVALAPPGADAWAIARIVAGVGIGSTAWWVVLVGGVAIARRSISANAIRLLRRGSAVLLVAFGAVALASVLLG